MLELADACEKATGPDRELDARIACAVKFRDLRPARPDDFDGKYGFSPGNIKVETGFLMADRYTASIDAALTLVPDGYEWLLEGEETERHYPPSPWLYKAEVGSIATGEGSTPALALCAAALRAGGQR